MIVKTVLIKHLCYSGEILGTYHKGTVKKSRLETCKKGKL